MLRLSRAFSPHPRFLDEPVVFTRPFQQKLPSAAERGRNAMLPHGLEPWTSQLLAERSNQLGNESRWVVRPRGPLEIALLVHASDRPGPELPVIRVPRDRAPLARHAERRASRPPRARWLRRAPRRAVRRPPLAGAHKVPHGFDLRSLDAGARVPIVTG